MHAGPPNKKIQEIRKSFKRDTTSITLLTSTHASSKTALLIAGTALAACLPAAAQHVMKAYNFWILARQGLSFFFSDSV